MTEVCSKALLALSAAVCLTVGASADVMWPGARALHVATRPLTWAVIAVMAVTILLIRRNGKKR